jgi:hypothetical protein
MKAEELRLGNYIYWNIPEKLNVIHTVVGIVNYRPQTVPISLGDSMDDYRPILLNESWLYTIFRFDSNSMTTTFVPFYRSRYNEEK